MPNQKKKLNFIAFNDGVVRFLLIDEDDNLDSKTKISHRFNEKTVGVKRYYAARSVNIEIERVIEIYQDKRISSKYAAVIGNTRYKIEQVQHISDTLPKTTVISLSQRGLYEGDYNEV